MSTRLALPVALALTLTSGVTAAGDYDNSSSSNNYDDQLQHKYAITRFGEILTNPVKHRIILWEPVRRRLILSLFRQRNGRFNEKCCTQFQSPGKWL